MLFGISPDSLEDEEELLDEDSLEDSLDDELSVLRIPVTLPVTTPLPPFGVALVPFMGASIFPPCCEHVGK